MTPSDATAPDPDAAPRERENWLGELERVDRAVYAAIAGTPTTGLDRAMRELSRAADYSRLSVASAAGLALLGGPAGRRAAASGLASVTVTAAVVNLVIKPLGRRHRPDRTADEVPLARQVRMPGSRSFPSGHTAAAVAFASGAARVVPAAGIPLHALAALVGYARVHTGVHYPGDVVAGALLGSVIAEFTSSALARRWTEASGSGARNRADDAG
jgi:membrane-associated phospholipid phosphatase